MQSNLKQPESPRVGDQIITEKDLLAPPISWIVDGVEGFDFSGIGSIRVADLADLVEEPGTDVIALALMLSRMPSCILAKFCHECMRVAELANGFGEPPYEPPPFNADLNGAIGVAQALHHSAWAVNAAGSFAWYMLNDREALVAQKERSRQMVLLAGWIDEYDNGVFK